MKLLNIDNWNRKDHFEFFNQFEDPYFSVTVDFDVSKMYAYSKAHNLSFFVLYLHACMKAINSVESFKYRLRESDNKVVVHDIIHASATILRADNTFGFSFIHYDDDFKIFNRNFEAEKERILNSKNLFPIQDTDDSIYCSAMQWFNFSAQKEPVLGSKKESVPKLAFGKFVEKNNKLQMPVAIAVNHALVDGYHVGQFTDAFQNALINF